MALQDRKITDAAGARLLMRIAGIKAFSEFQQVVEVVYHRCLVAKRRVIGHNSFMWTRPYIHI